MDKGVYLLTGQDEGGLWEEGRRIAREVLNSTREGHPDFLLLTPQKGSIKIEAIRELIPRLVFAPLEAERIVVMIHEADRLTDGAANALLKTLEEPPPYLLFLLTTTNPERLLLTIRSRCQRLLVPTTVPSLPMTSVRETLSKILSNQSTPRTAVSKMVRDILDQGEDLSALMKGLTLWWRDRIVSEETKNPEDLFDPFDRILETTNALEGNVLKPLALERLFLCLK